MKCPILLTGLVLLSGMGLVGILLEQRRRATEMAGKIPSLEAWGRQTWNRLARYQGQLSRLQRKLDDLLEEVGVLNKELLDLHPKQWSPDKETQACLEDKKKTEEDLQAKEAELNSFTDQLKTEQNSWKQEITSLKQQVAQQSKLCDFVDKASEVSMQLCTNIQKTDGADEKKPEQGPVM
ncbi:hypothetical protein MATL_G00232060 [Megalops atlanticus]|uniref:Uncharacterized protein n=1 Tax=Megalops atlanticus TaxID=7932 RepID=A0A9D3SWG4_MEGAT|nr:hypothetical protein MATL_G00232060 [Megalops atlanticus]